MARKSYWDLDDQEIVTCSSCSWAGPVADCDKEPFEALMEVNCPRCSARIYLVDYPTRRETDRAARQGRPGAAAEALRRVRAEARKGKLLRDAEALPDLDGDDLHFEWDYERIDGEDVTIIRCAGAEVWREPAFWEGDHRFQVVFDLLRRRYGDRLASLTPTPGSELYLDGDSLRSRRAREERLDGYRRERAARLPGPDPARSFVAGYLDREKTPFIGQRAASWSDPEAFKAGWSLNDAEQMVQSAGVGQEFERDEQDLRTIVDDVLARYGQRVIDAARDAIRANRESTSSVPTARETATPPRYFVIQDAGDAAPYALVRMQPRGLYEQWTGAAGDEEWVDMPYFASYFSGGGIGAREITEADVKKYKGIIRPPLPGAVHMMRGDGKGLEKPGAPAAVPDSDPGPDVKEDADGRDPEQRSEDEGDPAK